ncbi:MAG: 2-oxoacid:acceptor oxidoreductase subunit alpha [Kordiimonadaceae bacterium]|jgi:2-oxoglutarate ferredoxin oxidoreductase subunit alpha|nr:2-oxoacid:acceptor oxidoreductase subunit alpha [Kordiimonadaceae bacterium]MBT7545664.1 2-oxoacid:acceptor oxidoreductase subunit alpha [Kordiimonadaceae bacterium]MBT7605573.1 2-oxoacid:acceptor oxidoreductase subunit alpha [Kordiimonadaceae bacterium]MDB4044018.1 2-oxoacid:acceptor oxidoreductase subunit alpha [Emcibacteraceae bacterium]MDC0082247.1 2-oxoacid:acceptor oxidoreductase subunit alpha [Emcibacteraceae bacterium]
MNAQTNAQGFEELDTVCIRFAGDSGDGMQLTGTQFSVVTALEGSDLATFPDFPAEIRAPVGTTFGVSAFQINFGSVEVSTAGDEPDVLVAMNPAALMVSLAGLRLGGLIIVDEGSFNKRNLDKAGYLENPLEDDSLSDYQVQKLDITKMTLESVKEFGLGKKDALRSKNMWTLGLILWMFGRARKPITDWLEQKFKKLPDVANANIAAINAGHAFGETAETSANLSRYHVGQHTTEESGEYRTVNGNQALAWGLVAGSQLGNIPLLLGTYPITPASALLHTLSGLKEYGVVTFQAEDEIAAVCGAIGASFAGQLGVTSSSGPGIALKTEAIGLAISTELPLVIIDVQRAGPSTGLPTKTEQSDLHQAVWGRNGDAPIVVLATSNPHDCFDVGIEAVRLATKYMTPVMVLSDGYIGNASEPWRIPDINTLDKFSVKYCTDPEGFHPFKRDPETLARVWAKPGTPDCLHRIGGIEKDYDTGHISYEPGNHQKMTDVRAAKIAGVANDIPEQEVSLGTSEGKLAVVGWGSTRGSIHQAVKRAREENIDVSHIHISNIWPLPRNLKNLLNSFDKVIVAEMNKGQMNNLLRAEYLLDGHSLTKVSGQPFKITEILDCIRKQEVEVG